MPSCDEAANSSKAVLQSTGILSHSTQIAQHSGSLELPQALVLFSAKLCHIRAKCGLRLAMKSLHTGRRSPCPASLSAVPTRPRALAEPIKVPAAVHQELQAIAPRGAPVLSPFDLGRRPPRGQGMQGLPERQAQSCPRSSAPWPQRS